MKKMAASFAPVFTHSVYLLEYDLILINFPFIGPGTRWCCQRVYRTLSGHNFLCNTKFCVIKFAKIVRQLARKAGSFLDATESTRDDQGKTNPGGKPAVGMTQDTFTIEGNVAVIRWPAALSPEQYQDLQDWIKVALRRTAREAGVKPT
jgi:hypothetical protein